MCAETEIVGVGCTTQSTYYGAANTCMGVGARLCTADELAADQLGCRPNAARMQPRCNTNALIAMLQIAHPVQLEYRPSAIRMQVSIIFVLLFW